MAESFEGLAGVGAEDPAASASITEEVKAAIATLRQLRTLGPEGVADPVDDAEEYLDSLQEFIETGEEPDEWAEERAAYDGALGQISEVQSAVCA
jgi:hypothetical protein